MKNNEQGFTLPELISVIAVTSIFVGLIMFFMISFWRYGYLLEADLDTFVTRLNAQDYLRTAIGDSAGLINQNSIADNHTGDPDPANASNLYWEPIHAVPGNIPIGATNTTSPLLYYRRASISTANAVILNGSQPYEDEFVLYLDGTSKNLMLRSLANSYAPDNRLKTSCPPDIATDICPPDKILSSDVASVNTKYFSRNGNLIDYHSIWDANINDYAGPDFPAVEVLELTINISKKPIFQKTNATVNSTIIRVALRNT